MVVMKTCSKCGKPHTDDTRMCPRCKQWARDFYHRKNGKEYSRELYYRNHEHILESRRNWYNKNRERLTEYVRNWRKSKPDYLHNWYKKNFEEKPERYHRYNHNRRARILGNGGELDKGELSKLFDKQRGCCYLCGELLYGSFDRSVHIDHKIPLSRGGSNELTNIALAHSDCNLKKYTKTPNEYLTVLNG